MRVGIATMLGFALAGCGASSDDGAIKSVSQNLVWSCYSYSVQLGSSLECATSSDGISTTSSDGTTATGGATTSGSYNADAFGTVTGGFGSSGTTYGVTGGTSASAPPAADSTSTSTGGAGSDSLTGTGNTSTSMDGVSYGTIPGEYSCQAGSSFCPPIDARPGATFVVNGDGSASASGPPGAGSTTSGSGGASTGGDDDDDDGKSSDGKKPGKGGGSSSGNPGASSTASSSDGVSSTYHCVFDGKKRSCKKAIPICDAGSIPIPGGQCGTPNPGAGSVVSGPGETVTTSNNKSVSFQGCTSNADGTTTCTYQVSEVDGGQDLSNWVLGTNCAVVGGNPRFETVNPDPNAGITGIKWETGDGFSSGAFAVTVKGNVSLGVVSFATKAPGVALGQISGPVCQ